MVQARLHLYVDAAVSKTYIIEGYLQQQEQKTQTSIDLPFPGLADDESIINSLFGQKRIFTSSFIIMDRDDDYTNGTGTPSTYDSEEQRAWLMDEIYTPGGFHVLQDTNGNLYSGRIENLQIVNAGDDPVKLDAVFTFKRGIVPTAGNYSPI